MTARLSPDLPLASAASWPARRPPSPAYAAACAEIEAQAIRTADTIIELRARRYALHPRHLDALETNSALMPLSQLARWPTLLRQRIRELIEAERATQRRRMGMGGEIPMINLRAAARYAQQLCDMEAKQDRDARGRFVLEQTE